MNLETREERLWNELHAKQKAAEAARDANRCKATQDLLDDAVEEFENFVLFMN